MSFYEGFFKALLTRNNGVVRQPIPKCERCFTDISFIKFECYNETINVTNYDQPKYGNPIVRIYQWEHFTFQQIRRTLIEFYKLCRSCPILHSIENIEKDIAGFLKQHQEDIDEEFIKLYQRLIKHRIPFNTQQLSRNLFHINLARYIKPVPFIIDRMMEHNDLPKDICSIIYSYWII